jgi:hypothetical protein
MRYALRGKPLSSAENGGQPAVAEAITNEGGESLHPFLQTGRSAKGPSESRHTHEDPSITNESCEHRHAQGEYGGPTTPR